MHRLVLTTGCPTVDAKTAVDADVVLRADRDELVLLRYSPGFLSWYACGCLSVNAAEQETIPDAQLYWKGVGYVEDAVFEYAVFESDPLNAPEVWNDFYRKVWSCQRAVMDAES